MKLQFVAALREFTRAQAGNFGDEGETLRSSLGSMRRALDRWDRAIGDLETHVLRADLTADRHVALASVYLDRHRPDDALRELTAAARLDSRRVEIYRLQALAYGLMDRPGDAAAALSEAAALDDGEPTVWYALAQQLVALGRDEEAAAALRRFYGAVQATQGPPVAVGAPFERTDLLRETAGAAPVLPVARYAAGYVALGRGDYRKALSQFMRVVDTDPLVPRQSRARMPLLKAAAALRAGDVDEALRLLEGASSAAPGEAEVHRLIGLALFADGQTERSVVHLRTAVSLAPWDDRVHARLADVLVASNRLEEAQDALLRAIEAVPESPGLRYRLARVYEAQSRWADAVDAFVATEVRGIVVGFDHLYEMLGSIHIKRGDLDRAVEAYARRIAVNPNNADAHRQLADIYFLQGRDDQALAEYGAAMFIDPRNARAAAGMGQVHLRARRYPAAVDALRRAVALGEGGSVVRYVLATSLIRIGRVDEGRAELEIARRIQAETIARGRRDFRVEALRRIAAAALEAGRYDDALTALREALAHEATGSTRLYRDLGLVLIKAGRIEEGVGALARFQTLAPTEAIARELAAAYAAMQQHDESRKQLALAERLRQEARGRRLRDLAGVVLIDR
ncbi:MAG TPA: tetratricopeptide repeat protein [Vicinamibacterales bacterium]|nr:tetratricopeptide repeat protein [Vicinamibacterales bacterium]